MARFLRISDFCDTSSGGTPSREQSDRYYGGSIPWVKSGELRENLITDTEEKITEYALLESSAKINPVGSILLAMYGATVGRMATLGIDAATNQAICAIKPNLLIADPRYVYHALKYKVPVFLSKAVGGAQPNISQSLIRNTKVYLPHLEEQRLIAAKLDKADAIHKKRREALKLADKFLRSVFLDMFGDPVTNSKRWTTEKFANLGNLERGKSRHRPRDDAFLYGGPYPFIQTGDIANSEGVIEQYQQTYSELGLQQSRLWPKGTLCITIAANIGKTGILGFDACFPDSVVGFTGRKGITPEFIQFWLNEIQVELERAAPQVAQKNINLEILSRLDTPVPPLREQQLFSRIVAKVRKMKLTQRRARDESDMLFSSLSQKVFTG